MRKKLTLLVLTAVIAAAMTAPALACTPNLNLDIWGDMTPPSEIEYTPSEDIDKVCNNAARKWLEEHPIEYTPETETETEIRENETELENTQKYIDWKKYIPESLRARWYSFIRR